MSREAQKACLLPTPRPLAKFAPALYFTETNPDVDDSEYSPASEEADSPDDSPRPQKTSVVSRLSIDFEMFFDILENKHAHQPFEEVATGDSWLYQDEDGAVLGPFSSLDMNLYFQQDRFSSEFHFKKSSDEKFLPFDQILKRYYKRLHPEMISQLTNRRPRIDQLALARTARGEGESQSSTSRFRDLRILSDQVRPTFAFKTKADPQDVETSDGEELFETRCRSTTIN